MKQREVGLKSEVVPGIGQGPAVDAAVEQVTGLMTIEYPDGKVRYGFWDKGGPVGWRTEPMAEDEALERELVTSPKNRAENVMIADLLRNDIGRVAMTGWRR